MSRKTVILAVLGLVAGLSWWRWPGLAERSGVPQPPLPPRFDAPQISASPGQARSMPSAVPEPDVVTGMSSNEIVSKEYEQRLRQAIATGDALEWEPIIGELRNPRYDAKQAIALLVSLLDAPEPMVRVRAAQLLLELGSRAGVAALNEALHAAATGAPIPGLAVATAAAALHQFRLPINGDDLFACWQRFQEPRLLEFAAMAQAAPVYELVRDRRASGQGNFQTDWLAAYSGMKDPQSIERYQRLAASANDHQAQLLGHWALYQATGNASDLEYVIGCAREVAGLDSRTARSEPWAGTAGPAFDFLKITVTLASTRALEEIAEFTATRGNGNSDLFQRSFGALFYIHEDYDFVDRRVLAFMRGQYAGAGVSPTLMWKIAAARRTPEIEAAAKALNPAAYEHEFIALHGRPVESWADMSHVPVTVRPPLPAASGRR